MRILSVSVVMLVAGAASADPQFEQVDLVSDGAVAGTRVDTNLMNPWGLASGPDTPWWVANNATDSATIYGGDGTPRALVVSVPGSPTGAVFNPTDKFPVCTAKRCSPSKFIFAGEDGVITAWAADVPRPGPSDQAFVVFASSDGAVYKGLTLVQLPHGVSLLYATDFHNARVDAFDESFHRVPLSEELFDDDRLPRGYAPFGIHAFGDRVYVTYALQDAAKHDDVKGPGHGFVDEYDLVGRFVRRVASRGHLDSPWGLAFGPESFGEFDDALLVGNFGDGRIHGYRFVPHEGRFVFAGTLRDCRGEPITIDGLWSIAPGNGAAAGSPNDLYFTAGLNGEADGLFGFLRRAR
ncbi:MAG TPA: TIGR03118 family protein [Polyangia bacterium]|jgi:uncharacterized protein (TIGR03118 family)|nr:TIGR03118 family protein [Polyangia bacterium]